MKSIKMMPLKRALLFIPFLMAGCSQDQSANRLRFNNNNECIYWSTSGSTIKSPLAYSGNHMSKINAQNPFSTMLDIRVKDISDKPLRRAKITAWFMLTANNTEQNLVLDVRDSTLLKSYEWINVDAADFSNELNKWAKAELIVDLTNKDRNNINNIYRIYASNGKEEPVYVDDFEVEFEN